ncbi:MAG: hypothetical protein GXP53_14090 [Deltaproteobacteria bacterium]|nr:hypothetical protein [Deltaproteobacteria bacterium]
MSYSSKPPEMHPIQVDSAYTTKKQFYQVVKLKKTGRFHGPEMRFLLATRVASKKIGDDQGGAPSPFSSNSSKVVHWRRMFSI